MSSTTDYTRIERAIRFLLAHASPEPDLAQVADHVGLSPFHFQRLFKRWAGTTPKRFLRYLSATAARARLIEASSVLDASLDLGLSGPGRLHDLTVSVYAATPGEVRGQGAGLVIRYGTRDTPYGPARMGLTDRGVTSLAFLDPTTSDAPTELAALWPAARLEEDTGAVAPWFARIFGKREDARVPLHVRGTNLQLRVWEALLRIPPGRVVSYGSLAGALGVPRGARAIAGAVAANPVGYLIPCHRVLRATGAVSGYRWGPARKLALLAREFGARDAVKAPARP